MSDAKVIAPADWEWFGLAGHFICGDRCQFHMTTKIGSIVVSTIGRLLHDAGTREITAEVRGIALTGKGDARLADYMNKIGYEDIGFGCKFETMVFRTVVADHPIEGGVMGTEDVEAYGGYLIAETVAPCNKPIIAAAPQLLEALKGAKRLFIDGSPFYIAKLGAPITNFDQAVIDLVFIEIEQAIAAAEAP